MAAAEARGAESISVDEHLQRVLAALKPLDPVRAPLGQCLGRTLATGAAARVDVPGFDNSSMDGYAVLHSDVATTPARLQVIGDVAAGSSWDPPLAPGECVRIMTGAPMPSDADCVVPVEDTDGGTEEVLIHGAPEASRYIRRAGSDIRRGALVLPAGRTLRATDLAAAAAAGLAELSVHPAPRVGVLSTGDELAAPAETLRRGQIHDSNSVLLAAAVTEAGGIPVPFDAVVDDPDALREALARASADVDVFITSGGVSVGAYDVVKAVLAPLGVWFGPVRIQPGKPQGFGQWTDGTPIFTLPGNPVSVFVSFEAFVRPALMALQGRAPVTRPANRAVASSDWRSPAGRAQYMPVVLTRSAAGASVRPVGEGGSGSHLVASLAGANAFAIVAENVTEIRAGDSVSVLAFDEPPTSDPMGEP